MITVVWFSSNVFTTSGKNSN